MLDNNAVRKLLFNNKGRHITNPSSRINRPLSITKLGRLYKEKLEWVPASKYSNSSKSRRSQLEVTPSLLNKRNAPFHLKHRKRIGLILQLLLKIYEPKGYPSLASRKQLEKILKKQL